MEKMPIKTNEEHDLNGDLKAKYNRILKRWR